MDQPIGDELWRPVLARALPRLPLIADPLVFQFAAVVETDEGETILDTVKQIDVSVPPALGQARVRHRVGDILLGRACAKLALEHAGSSSGYVGAGSSREPIWPDGWTGSISHAKGMAWAVVARRDEFTSLGIDLEHRLGEEVADSVHSVALTPTERLFEAWNDTSDLCWRTTLLFSAKESIFKCLSPLVNEFIDFTEIELTSVKPEAGQLCFTPLRRLSPWLEPGQQLEVRFASFGNMVLTATGWPRIPNCQG